MTVAVAVSRFGAAVTGKFSEKAAIGAPKGQLRAHLMGDLAEICMPNLLHPDGKSFLLWRGGEMAGAKVRLDGDVVTAGAAPGGNAQHEFITDQPEF